MATADLKLIYGSGGGFSPSFFSGSLNILAGAIGTIITITAPAGKKVRLTSLWSSSDNSDMSVLVNGSAVVSSLILAKDPTTIGSFTVGSVGLAISPSVGSSNTINYIESINTITVVKNTGSTVGTVFYSYAYGD